MQDWEWFFLDASATRHFQLGDTIAAGQLVGYSLCGQPVRAEQSRQIVAIQYDIERDEVIQAAAPTKATGWRAAPAYAARTAVGAACGVPDR